MAVERAREDEAGDRYGGLEGEAECEGEDVSALAKRLFPAALADTVVRVQEHDEPCLCECPPQRLEARVVESSTESPAPDDDAPDVGQRCLEVCHRREER